jgi:hypothetical protein
MTAISATTSSTKTKSPTHKHYGGSRTAAGRLIVYRFLAIAACVVNVALVMVAVVTIRQGGGAAHSPLRSLHASGNNASSIDLIEELLEATSEKRLMAIAKQYKAQYAAAKPFPHVALDGIFPERLLQILLEEVPEANGCYDITKCFWLPGKEFLKSYVDKEANMGPYTRIVFGLLRSSTWIRFLEELSGIHGIVPDPHYRGSGIHVTGSGGNLNVHADFNRHNDYKLDRRVNTFVYLNDDWKAEYGGHLELWSQDMKSCVQNILPTLGRYVVFSSTDFSYHGHPQPLACPKGRSRRSMALYYYSNGRPESECLDRECSGKGHSTMFQKPVGCKVCQEDTCKAYRNDATPNWVEKIQ